MSTIQDISRILGQFLKENTRQKAVVGKIVNKMEAIKIKLVKRE